MSGCPVHHGVSKAQGCSHVAVSSFTKLFPKLDGLAVSEEDAALLGGPGGLMHDFDGGSPDSPIPAGYTFFAQFIDHDVTLDIASGLRDAPLDLDGINKLPNVRSASLDLDCVYGFGPEASPHIYDSTRPGRLAIAESGHDLARSPGGTALIGDPRNDENLFVSQLQLLFHRFHNRIYDERIGPVDGGTRERFEVAQESTRYHYQWLVLFDFLKRLCDRDIYKQAVTDLFNKKSSFPHFYPKPAKGENLEMPVEFSVAAYRMGHTMVRSVYAVNADHLDIELFDQAFGTEGFSSIPEELTVDWRYLLDIDACIIPRMSKALDPLLADEMQQLPTPVVPSNNPNDRALAFRNLLRGNALSLPSGQDVAEELATKYKSINTKYSPKVPGSKGLSKATPLFFYVLAESRDLNGGERLGPVGSAILLEVFGGMLKYCGSFVDPEKKDWTPDPCVSKEHLDGWAERYPKRFDRKLLIEDADYFPFELGDLVRFVG